MLYELNLRFPDEDHVQVSFEDVDSGALPFVNPLITKDLRDLQWYLEVYGAHSLGDPDDTEAARIAGRLPRWGTLLFAAVFAERAASRLFDRFQDQEDGTRLLTITAEQPSILALPWELLHDSSPGGGFLFLENPRISIRRRVAGMTGGRRPFRVEAKDRLHLLFVISRPEGAGFLDPRADARAVLDALEEHAPGRVTWEFLRPPTLDALIERLEDSGKPPVDVLHFDGHGVFDDRGGLPEKLARDRARPARTEELLRAAPASAPNTGYLLFETAEAQLDFVSAQRLGENLHRHRVSLVILSACQSAKVGDEGEEGDPDRPMGSVAARLTATGIPAVLAMTHSVLVPTTRRLFGAMYKDLARHRGIGESLDNARRHLREHPERYEIQRGPDRVWLRLQDWFLPALYQSGQDVALLQAAPEKIVAPPAPPRTNLKAAREAGFFGRRRELWQIERAFSGSAAGQARRITVTGFGGQGKTALAQEAGRWLLRTGLFAAAVFVDYSRIQAADSVAVAVSNIGSVLGESLLDEDAAREALVRTPTLMILDNLEALEPEPLRELLEAAAVWSNTGRSRVLLTTRRPDFGHAEYRVDGTFVHRRVVLAGLGSRRNPDDALEWFAALTKLPPAPAIQGSPARGELIDLFEKVRFHPLSIRVLAQQLKTRRPAELGERLEQLLVTRSEAAAPGDRDEALPELVASVQLSLDRLDTAESSVLPRLGVFQGGAFEDGLLAITEIPAGEWAMLRKQLAAAALVEEESPPGVAVSFLRFHPTLAPMLWAQVNPEDRERLGTAYRRRYHALANYLYNEDNRHPHEARGIVQLELPNLLHAVHAAFAAGDPGAGDFADSIAKFLNAFGLRREASSLIERAQNASMEEGSGTWYLAQSGTGNQLLAEGHLKEAATVFQQLLGQLGEAPSYRRAVTLLRLGRCLNFGGRPDLAEQHLRAALRVLDGLDASDENKRLRGTVHTDLADVLKPQGRFSEARQNYEEGLEMDRELSDLRGQGVSLLQLGTLAMQEGNFQEAVERYGAAQTLLRQFDEPEMEAVALHQLGMVLQEMGQLEEAERNYRDAARIKEENGMIGGINGAITTWNQLAILNHLAGNVAVSESWYRKVIEASKALDSSVDLCHGLFNLSNLLSTESGRLAEARKLAEDSLVIRQTFDPGAAEIWGSYNLLARISDQDSRPAEAREYRRLAREAKWSFAGTLYELRRHGPFIGAAVTAVSDETWRGLLDAHLRQSEQKGWTALVAAVRRILVGERNEEELCEGLDLEDSMIVIAILRALEDPSTLDTLLEDPEPA